MHENAAVSHDAAPALLPALLAGHALLQLLDLATTALALQAGGVEANPVARLLIERGWWAYALVKLTVAALFLALWPVAQRLGAHDRRLVTGGTAAFGVLMVGVVANNAAIAFA